MASYEDPGCRERPSAWAVALLVPLVFVCGVALAFGLGALLWAIARALAAVLGG